ncbi:hypothetical protein B0H14DRAFT_2658510 [Mycena olivaceomarginata]|nr:hypothetical protein B0H14DRAFT_2658510 [Mycena olivaceomarginata]
MVPSSVISRSASAVSKGARKLKKKVSNLIESISSGRSRKSKSTPSASEKAAESDADDKVVKWTSPIYPFIKDNVKTLTDSHNGRKYQAFKCKAPGGCKTKVNSDPHSDWSSISNLKKHAKQCWGADVIDTHIRGVAADASRDGSIFAAFARSRQHPVNVSHRTHTQPEFRVCLICWITEANRPFKIVQDHQLQQLLTACHPELKEYDGRLSFATDAWTSPNHCAFVAWTIHLQHKHEPLVLLLDIFEVPEMRLCRLFHLLLLTSLYSHTLVKSSHILSWMGENTTSNDTQNTALDRSSENDFDAVNHVRCFNHTLNLAVKVFMRSF